MSPFTERSPEPEDQPDANVHSTVRLTVQEAAAALGITVEAVRGRMHRGKYGREKAEDGRVYVVLTPDQLPNDRERSSERSEPTETPGGPGHGERSGDRSSTVRERSPEREELVEELRDHVAFLRAELEARNAELRRREEEHREEARRKDTIIAQLTRRIPELEAPSEPSGAPETASEGLHSTHHAPPAPGTPASGQQEPSQRRRRSWWREFFGLE